MAGMTQFMKRLRRGSRAPGGSTAVEFRAEGIALAHVENRLGHPAVTQCVFLPGESHTTQAGSLKDMVKSLGLAGSEVILVLSTSDYRLLAVDAPDVPSHELRDAVRWKIGDMIDFPVDQAAVDVFEMPDGAVRGGSKSVFVAASQRKDVRAMLDHLEGAGLEAHCIDITHLALRNLVDRCVEDGLATALLILEDRSSHLVIMRGGNIYLARPVNFSSRVLQHEGNEREIGISQLVGELKRSLDYFEIQLRQDPVASLVVAPLDIDGDLLVEKLGANVGVDTFLMNVSDMVPCDAALPATIQHHCAAVIGGALRVGGGS